MLSSNARCRLAVLGMLTGAAAGAGCDGREPAGANEGDEQDDDRGVGGHVALPLLAGRTVEVEEQYRPEGWDTTKPWPLKKRRVALMPESTSSSLGTYDIPNALWQACMGAEMVASFGGNFDDDLHSCALGLVWTCAGHRAMQIAEQTQTIEISDYQQPWDKGQNYPIILDKGRTLPEPFRTALEVNRIPGGDTRLSPLVQNWDPKTAWIRYRIAPPSATDRASWALLAEDLFRHGARNTAASLASPHCDNGGPGWGEEQDGRNWNTVVKALNDETTTLRDLTVAALADSTVSMLEAAEKAQAYIEAAASDQRSGLAQGAAQRSIESWRSRHDSRLEGVGSYVHVPEGLYERAQLVPLWYGAQYGVLTTTPEASGDRQYAAGWVYPPDLAMPVGHVALRTWKAGARVFTTDGSDATVLARAPGATVLRREGWVPVAEVPGVVTQRVEVDDEGSVVRLYTDPLSSLANTGIRYPVVTATPLTAGDRRVEELLRTTRVNPCLSAHVAQTHWCKAALAELPTRTRDAVATDLLTALQRGNVAFAKFTSGLAFLTSIGATLDDVQRAATRIVQSAEAMGRPITLDPLSQPSNADNPATVGVDERETPSLVLGTGSSREPAHPAYLYAITAGRHDFSSGVIPGLTYKGAFVQRGAAYAQTSVIALLDYVRLTTKALLPSGTLPLEPWQKTLKEVHGVVEQYANDSASMSVTRGAAGEITNVHLFRGQLSKQYLPIREACDVWLGEQGLNCALSSDPSAAGCINHRFSEDNDANSAAKWNGITTTGFADFGLDASEAPLRTINGQPKRAILPGDRFYAVCDLGKGAPEVVLSAEASMPPEEGTWGRHMPPFSPALLEALSRGLGPDPENPEQSALSCAGVPYNVKIPLENELSEAFDGADSIESSFAHYLRLAVAAADRADELGNQLIDQGLQMDMRAEAAREELENLCGGVIDVTTLEAKACQYANCSIPELLTATANTSTSVTGDPTSDSELAGVARCLGLAGAPEWAAVGDQQLCIWRYYPANGAKQLPMTCPPPDGSAATPACHNLNPKPLLPAPGKTCSEMFGKGVAELPAAPAKPAAGNVYAYLTNKLNIAATKTVSYDQSGDANRFECGNLMALREAWMGMAPSVTVNTSFGPVKFSNVGYTRPEWANQEQLRQIADVIGYEEDMFGLPTLTRNGKPWLRFGDEIVGAYAAEGVDFTWPYTRHPMLEVNPLDPAGRYDSAAAAICDRSAGIREDARSLFCGGYDPSRVSEVGRRLRAAVEALKGVSGASFENMTSLIEHEAGRAVSIDGKLNAGPLPGWFSKGMSGSDYWVSPDHSRISYLKPNGRGVTGRLVTYIPVVLDSLANATSVAYAQAAYPLLNAERRSMWVSSDILWSDSWRSTGRAVNLGVGDMNRFVAGEQTNIRSQVRWEGACTLPKGTAAHRIESCNPQDNAACQQMVGSYVDDVDFASVESGDFQLIEGCMCKGLPQTYEQLMWAAANAQYNFSIFPGKVATALKAYQQCVKTDKTVLGEEVAWPTMLDGLELACAARSSGPVSCPTLLATAPNINGVEDFPKLRARIACTADAVQEQLDRMYVADLPPDVIADLSAGGIIQTFPTHRGEYGETVAKLAAQITAMRAQADHVVQAVRDVGVILDRSAAQADALGLNVAIGNVDAYIAEQQQKQQQKALEIQKIRTRQAISTSVASCISAVAQATGGVLDWFTGKAATAAPGAIATCANTALQVASESEIDRINEQNSQISDQITSAVKERIAIGDKVTEAELRALMYSMILEISEKFDEINEAKIAVQAAQSEVHASLARLDSQRNQARRAAAKVLLLGSDDVGRQYAVNSTMRARMNTLRIRYEKARDNAIRLSYLARRAVEQKLGLDLSLMSEDLTLVEAPSKWVDTLCSLSGIDYNKIRTGGRQTVEASSSADGGVSVSVSEGNEASADGAPEDYDYADGYVGDWVRKLQNFLESYSVDYPFQAGSDIAVISLRDEILNVRESEEMEGWNLLYHTDGSLMSSAVSSEDGSRVELRGWELTSDDSYQATLTTQELDLSPFACGDSAVGCRALGGAKAITLTAAGGDSDGSGQPAAVAPANAFSHFRADSCTETSPGSGYIASCRDLSGNANQALFIEGGPVPFVPSGIGGRPTLDMAGHSWEADVQGRWSSVLTDRFTVSLVYEPKATNVALQNFAPEHVLPEWAWDHEGLLSAAIPAAREARPYVGSIVTVVADGPNGAKVYVDGTLRSQSLLPISTVRLQGGLTWPLPSRLAERLLYATALSSSELAQLHRYLGARYKISLQGPAHWLDATDLASGRSNGGKSLESGYVRNATALYDRASGEPLGTQTSTSSNLPSGPSSFSAGPRATSALLFDGDDILRFGALGSSFDMPSSGDGSWVASSDLGDYVATVVARVAAATGRYGLWAGKGPGGSEIGIQVDADQQAVIVTRLLNGVSTVDATGPNAFSRDKPFVISLAGSRARGEQALFVNGRLELTLPGPFWPNESDLGMGFVGAIADYQLLPSELSDPEISAMHGQLRTKFGFPTAGTGAEGAPPTPETPVPDVAHPARMRQTVEVASGNYWLSWYQRYDAGDCQPASVYLAYPDGTTETRDPNCEPADTMWPSIDADRPDDAAIDIWLTDGWLRHYLPITVSRGGTLDIGFLVDQDGYLAELAGMQLEIADSLASALPRAYFATAGKLSGEIGEREDEDGSSFRKRWHRECEYYCPANTGDSCAEDGDVSGLPKRCFWEVEFGLSLQEIEKGELLSQAGFSRGNFNYRFDEMAVNIVGTGVKNCEGSALPSACYAGNFLQYSVRHDGPFRIRNYDGDSHRAPLFPGRIQQAKALLAERYLTNPISGADRNLVSDYWRTEMRGRPMDGSFKLRIYDSDGFDWNALEDVQLITRYRYWTRLN